MCARDFAVRDNPRRDGKPAWAELRCILDCPDGARRSNRCSRCLRPLAQPPDWAQRLHARPVTGQPPPRTLAGLAISSEAKRERRLDNLSLCEPPPTFPALVRCPEGTGKRDKAVRRSRPARDGRSGPLHLQFKCAALASTRTVTLRAPCKVEASGFSTGIFISPIAEAPSTRPGRTVPLCFR